MFPFPDDKGMNMEGIDQDEDLADFLRQQFDTSAWGGFSATVGSSSTSTSQEKKKASPVLQSNARIKRKLLKKSPDAPVRYSPAFCDTLRRPLFLFVMRHPKNSPLPPNPP